MQSLPNDYDPRYVRILPTRKQVLEWPAGRKGWMRTNQSVSSSGLMWFELRKSIVLFYVPQPTALGGGRRKSSRRWSLVSMRPRAQIPLPEDEFPPPPHDVDLKLFNGFVVTTTSEIRRIHSRKAVQDERLSLGQKRRRSSGRLSDLWKGVESETFPPCTWRFIDRDFLVILGRAFLTLPNTRDVEYQVPTGVTGIICTQGSTEEMTDLWYASLMGICAMERYIGDCLKQPGRFPSRATLYSLIDSVGSIPEDNSVPSELFLGASAWEPIIYEPLLQFSALMKNINSIDMSRMLIPQVFLAGNLFFDLVTGRKLPAHQRSVLPAISLNGQKMTVETLRQLLNISKKLKIRFIQLNHCQLRDVQEVGTLLGQLILCGVESLSCAYNPIGLNTINGITNVLSQSSTLSLQRLFLHGSPLLNQKDLSQLVQQLHSACPNLQIITVSDQTYNNDEITQFALDQCLYVCPLKNLSIIDSFVINLKQNPFRSGLDLSYNKILKLQDLNSILECICYFPSISRLDVSWCIGPIELEAIPKKSPQQILDVMGKLPLGKLQGPPTASKNGFPFLKSLSLEGCNFPYQNSKQLFSLVTLVIESQVGILNLSYTNLMNKAGAEGVGRMLRLLLQRSKLEVLELEACGLTNETIDQLKIELETNLLRTKEEPMEPSFPSLEVLNLCGNKLSSEGGLTLIKLLCQECPNLRHLDLSLNQIGDLSKFVLSVQNDIQTFDSDSLFMTRQPSGLTTFRQSLVALRDGDENVSSMDIAAKIDELFETSEKRRLELLNKEKAERKQRLQQMAAERRERFLREVELKLGSLGRTELRFESSQQREMRTSRLRYHDQLVRAALLNQDLPSFMDEVILFVQDNSKTYINFSERVFCMKEIEESFEFLNRNQLTVFDALIMSNMDMRNSEFTRLLAMLISNRFMFQTVDLSFNQLNSQIGTGFVQFIQECKITKLILDGNLLDNTTTSSKLLRSLCLECPTLKELSCKGVGFGDVTCNFLSHHNPHHPPTLTINENLLFLRLQHNSLSTTAVRHLLMFLGDRCPSLVAIDLGGSCAELSPEFLESHFSAFVTMKTLRAVTLRPIFLTSGVE